MCLIVAKWDKTGSFTLDNFDRSHSRNSDGMGIMYLENGRVKVERVVGALKQQRKVYQKHMNKPLFVLHQRYATHGAKGANGLMMNCHPFKIMDEDDGDPMDIYMAHNGVIGSAETSDKDMSDTWNFIENHLKPIIKAKPELLWDVGVQKLISGFIGTGNKLVFLTNANAEGFCPMLIFNKSQGTEVNGCWLSNTYSIANQGRAVHQTYFGGNREKDWDEDHYYNRTYGRSTYNSHYDWEYSSATGKYTYDKEEFDSWEELSAYRIAKEEEANKQPVTTTEEPETPPLVDLAGDSLFKKKEQCSALTNPNEIELFKEDLRQAVLDGTMSLEDVKDDLTKEELTQLSDELDELMNNEISALSTAVRAIYDPENVDKNQLGTLVDKVSKEFNYVDLEILVDEEPQIAADVLEYLLEERNSNKSTKAA